MGAESALQTGNLDISEQEYRLRQHIACLETEQAFLDRIIHGLESSDKIADFMASTHRTPVAMKATREETELAIVAQWLGDRPDVSQTEQSLARTLAEMELNLFEIENSFRAQVEAAACYGF